MKAIKFLLVCALGAFVMASCGKRGGESYQGMTQGEIDSVSYAVGVSFGAMLKSSNLQDINLTVVNKAMQDYINGSELKIGQEEAPTIIQTFMIKAQEALEVKRSAEQELWLAENAKNEGVQQDTITKLQWKVIKEGNMELVPSPEDTVEVNYEGRLLDGTVFDSSYEGGEPVKFPLNQVIKGWTDGIQKIGEGGEIELYIPYQLGYGARQAGDKIAPYSTLVFKVELLKVNKAAKKDEK
ncbi:MAG: FKBP-type peptidyl-prolyl cis-trans isomerase [Candidatus Egerieousia sp.]